VFAPNVGVMDKFFKQYLEPHADTSKPRWAWRPGTPVSALASPETLAFVPNSRADTRCLFPERRQHPHGFDCDTPTRRKGRDN
jgi:type VI protein secretion system component VasK